MSLSVLIVILLVVVFVAALIIFPEFRALFKGFTRVFIKDIATTPEGAEAIYGEKINDAQDAYNKADDAYKTASGKLSEAQKKLENLNSKLARVESACEAFVKENNIEMAQLKAEEREEIISDINRQKELVKAYQNAVKTTKEAYVACESRLKKLQKESRDVVENMKTNQQLKEIYDDMDELKNVTATDKLLDSVREKNNDLNSIVEGSRVVHESRTSTKLQRAEAEAKKLQSNEYLDSLKKKYNK